jgi:predicted Fe-Mo cluster-binding NifX family protein
VFICTLLLRHEWSCQEWLSLIVPVEKFEEKNSVISAHFGRAPSFVVIDLSEDGSVVSISSVENSSEHFGGRGSAEGLISKAEPDILVVRGMGPRGIQAFQSKGVAVLTGNVNTVQDALDAYLSGQLTVVSTSCEEARNQHSCH